MSEDTGKFALKDSLCWHCSRSTDGSCSWSDRFEPVDGWIAQMVKRKSQAYRESYLVIECPLFNVYKNTNTDDIGFRKLSDEVLARAGRDYLQLMKRDPHKQGECRGAIIALERFFKSEYAELFSENLNPVYIMEAIQKQVGVWNENV